MLIIIHLFLYTNLNIFPDSEFSQIVSSEPQGKHAILFRKFTARPYSSHSGIILGHCRNKIVIKLTMIHNNKIVIKLTMILLVYFEKINCLNEKK